MFEAIIVKNQVPALLILEQIGTKALYTDCFDNDIGLPMGLKSERRPNKKQNKKNAKSDQNVVWQQVLNHAGLFHLSVVKGRAARLQVFC